jgi:hypothetical protein
MKPDQERVRTLLTETVALLCKNGLHYRSELRIQGLLGITLDGDDVFIVHIDECFNGANISLRTSSAPGGNSMPTTLPVGKIAVANEFSGSRSLGQATSYGTTHRQRRKQSSPRREIRSAICTDEFEEQESSLLKNAASIVASNSDILPSVDSDCATHTVENSVKLEQPDPINDGNPAIPSLTVSVKQENLGNNESDVICVDSKDDLPDNSAEIHQLQARAEEMAKNWLCGMTGRVTGYCGTVVGFSPKRKLASNVQAADLQAQLGARSHFEDGAVSDTTADFRLGEDAAAAAGCSWQFSAGIDQTAIPTSQNSIREVKAQCFFNGIANKLDADFII